jgi:hypothetical protein
MTGGEGLRMTGGEGLRMTGGEGLRMTIKVDYFHDWLWLWL